MVSYTECALETYVASNVIVRHYDLMLTEVVVCLQSSVKYALETYVARNVIVRHYDLM
jgi:hypothetical protein